MNKALFPVSILWAVLLCACSGKLPFTQKAPDFDTAYSVTAEINCGKLEATAEVTRKGKSDWEFSFTSPDNLSGIKMSIGEEGYTASLGSLSVTADDNSVYTVIPEIIAKSVD